MKSYEELWNSIHYYVGVLVGVLCSLGAYLLLKELGL